MKFKRIEGTEAQRDTFNMLLEGHNETHEILNYFNVRLAEIEKRLDLLEKIVIEPDCKQSGRVYCENCACLEKDVTIEEYNCTVPGNVSIWYSDTGEGMRYIRKPMDKNAGNDCEDFMRKQ